MNPMQRLAAPFPEHDVEWRVQSSGTTQGGKPWVRIIPYIRNIAVMARLDEVCSPERWANKFEQLQGGIVCGISIQFGSYWVTKWDGAAMTDVEAFKGGLSNAMKRAAVQWGVGRYLHDIGEQFAEFTTDRSVGNYLKANPQKHGAALLWVPPKLPAKYLPSALAIVNDAKDTRQPAATPIAETVAKVAGTSLAVGLLKLPGSKSNLMGFGGQRISDVPREHLPEIRRKLDELRNYDAIVTAIDEYLEATRPE